MKKGAASKPTTPHQTDNPLSNTWMMMMVVGVLGACILYLLSRISKMDKTVNRLEKEREHSLHPEELRDAVSFYMRENPEEVLIGCTPYLQRMLQRYPFLYAGPVQRVICDTLPQYMGQCHGAIEASVLARVQAQMAQMNQVPQPVSVPMEMIYRKEDQPTLPVDETYSRPPCKTVRVQYVPTTKDSSPLLFHTTNDENAAIPLSEEHLECCDQLQLDAIPVVDQTALAAEPQYLNPPEEEQCFIFLPPSTDLSFVMAEMMANFPLFAQPQQEEHCTVTELAE